MVSFTWLFSPYRIPLFGNSLQNNSNMLCELLTTEQSRPHGVKGNYGEI